MRTRPPVGIVASVALQLLLAATASGQAARYVGSAITCTKSGCHQEQKKWSETEETAPNRHKDAFDQVSRDPAKSMKYAQSIGLADPLSPTGRCVECHAPRNARFFKEGVSCEVCHGPGSKYEQPHDDQPYMTVGYPKSIALGMPDYIGKPQAWAQTCLTCHVVAEAALVAAGHPSGDDFDLSVKYKIVSSPNGNHWKTKYDARLAEIRNFAKQFGDPIRMTRTKGAPSAPAVAAKGPEVPAKTPAPVVTAPPVVTTPPVAAAAPAAVVAGRGAVPPPATPNPPGAGVDRAAMAAPLRSMPPPPAASPPPAMPAAIQKPVTPPSAGTPARVTNAPSRGRPVVDPPAANPPAPRPPPQSSPPQSSALPSGAPAPSPPPPNSPPAMAAAGLPRSPAALVAAVQGRALELLNSLLSRNAVVPARVRPKDPAIQYSGPDAELLKLQRDALMLALDALGTAPVNASPAPKP